MNHKIGMPELRFPGFKGEWKHEKLGQVCDKIQDGNYGGEYPKADEFVETGIPFLTSKALGGDGFLKEDKIDFISIEKHIKLKKAQLKLNDVLFTNRGSNVGSIGFTDIRIAHGNIGPQLTLLRSDLKIITPFFLYQIMKSEITIKQIRSQDSGSAMNFFGINTTSKFKLSLPTLPEQQKIASFLSAVDEKIQQLSRKKELLEQYKKGLMQQLFSGKLRFKDDNGNDYVDWEDTFFADTGKILIGLTHTPEYQPMGRPFLSSKNISGAFIDYNNIQYISEEKFQSMPESTKPKKGDILFTRVGSNLGNPKVIEEDIEFGIFVSLGVFRVNEKASNYFMRIWMDSDYFWRQLEQKVAGGAKNNLNTGWLKEFKLNLPSFPEQQKIANFLSSIDAKIESTSQQITQTQSFKKGLLQQMFV
jgi:type I restriction enzyme S subunit